jgi:hypothetical protein
VLLMDRSVEEEFNIGPDIKIKVLKVTGRVVRLGIVAPKELGITRPDDGPVNKTPAKTQKNARRATPYHPRRRLFCDPPADGQSGVQDNVRAVGSVAERSDTRNCESSVH